jgi:hypothetical protein
MNDESNKVKNYTKIIRRYFEISKPNGVSKIEFDLRPTGDDNEYYMGITYIVPEGSEYLQQDKPNNPHETYVNHRYFLNYHISKDLKNYFGLKVIINNSETRNEKFYNGK